MYSTWPAEKVRAEVGYDSISFSPSEPQVCASRDPAIIRTYCVYLRTRVIIRACAGGSDCVRIYLTADHYYQLTPSPQTYQVFLILCFESSKLYISYLIRVINLCTPKIRPRSMYV
jgi:hypothetical protein